MKLIGPLVLAFVMAAAGPLSGATPPDADRLTITLSGVSLHALVQYLSLYAGKPVILPDRFPGDKLVDIVSTEGAAVSGAKAMGIFAAVLRGAGFSLIETDDYVRVVPEGKAEDVPVRDKIPTQGLAAESLITMIVDLRYADAAKTVPLLAGLKSRAGDIKSQEGTNRLVITEYTSTLRVMLDVIGRLDTPPSPNVVQVYKVRNASVESLTGLARSFLKSMKDTAGAADLKRMQALSVEPHAPTNSFIFYGAPADIARVRAHVEQFDVKPEEAARQYHSYRVLHRDAKDLKTLLDGLLVTSGGGKDGGEPKPIITSDDVNNELIITASRAKYEEILPILQNLDRPAAQVVIESALVELSMDKLLDLGVELASLDGPGERPRGFGGTTFGMSTAAAGGRVPVAPAAGGLVGGIFKDSAFNIAALIQLAKRNEDVALIIAPSVMTRDNREATITIAELREYAKREFSAEGNTNVVTSGGFNEAATELKITPHINDEGTVRLEITTTVDQFLPSSQVEGVELVNKTSRKAKTEVTVPDGHTVVIGGLTSTVQVDTVSKVPILGDIPGLGFFFRRTTKTKQQRNLCVFIKPHVFRTADSLRTAARDRREELQNLAGKKEGAVLPQETFDKVTGGGAGL